MWFPDLASGNSPKIGFVVISDDGGSMPRLKHAVETRKSKLDFVPLSVLLVKLSARVAEIRKERVEKTKGPIVWPDIIIPDTAPLVALIQNRLSSKKFKSLSTKPFLAISVGIQGSQKGEVNLLPIGYSESAHTALRDLTRRASTEDPTLKRSRTGTGGNVIIALMINIFESNNGVN